MLGLVGEIDIGVGLVSENDAECSSDVAKPLCLDERELELSLVLACVTVSEFVSDTCSMLLIEAVSVDIC